MSRLELVVLAMLALGGFAEHLKKLPSKFQPPHKIADKTFLKKQMDLLDLYFHIDEPLTDPERKKISETWSLDKNIDQYTNITAVKIYIDLMQNKWLLPRGLPFSVLNSIHLFEAKTLYDVIYSSKDYDIFYKTAVYMRDRVNGYLYVYALSIAIIDYPETQSIVIPPLYEIFPSYFFNGQIMATAQKINTEGKRMLQNYPNAFLWDDNVVVNWNETVWPYFFKDFSLSYFTNDVHLNALYYNFHICDPFWLSGESGKNAKLNRGEYFWFVHKQILTHYYMERLSNDLGEIPELNFDVVEQGYESGLVYQNGIPFPSRPNHFSLNQPIFNDYISKIKYVESRIRNAIDLGYVIDKNGKKINFRYLETIIEIGNLIEGNVDSPDLDYYKDIVSLWKMLLGNSLKASVPYVNGHVPLLVPSALEQYQTTLRDPAFYMIWNRVLKFFKMRSSYLPAYEYRDLNLPSVRIEEVEVDKLVTYFENVYVNVSNQLYMTEKEAKQMTGDIVVLVRQPVLNHKPFNIRIKVKSEVAKKVDVRFFLAPKYDSMGVEIPLHENTFNFFQLDQFVYDLPVGKSVIIRESYENMYTIDKWSPIAEVYEKAWNAYNGKGEFVLDETEFFIGYPRRLMLPKGKVAGMPFILVVYIDEHHVSLAPYGTGSNPPGTFGYGTGARRMTRYPLNFPFDRPLYRYQVEDLDNMHFQEVAIYHKPMVEMNNPFH